MFEVYLSKPSKPKLILNSKLLNKQTTLTGELNPRKRAQGRLLFLG